MSEFKPTSEQVDCIEKFHEEEALRVGAYAGTGKTSTQVLMAQSTKQPIIYIGFNSSIVKEARTKFPQNATCKTWHGLAFGPIKDRGYSVDKMTSGLSGGFLAKRLRLREIQVTRDLVLKPRQHGFLVSETIKRWLRSDRFRISSRDVKFDGKLEGMDANVERQLKAEIAQQAIRVWEMMMDKASDIPLTHDGYLKLWALGRPQIDARYIMVDEAQDTNAIALGIIRDQQAPVTCVGDRHQQIYEWRGAVNAMEVLPAKLEARLTTSFRFGEAIAGYATQILELLDETLPLRGNPARESVIGSINKPDAILFRTNARLIERVFGLIGEGKRPHIVGGVADVMQFVEGAEKLMAGIPVDRPLELFGFVNWQEVQEASQMPGGSELQKWVKLIEDYGTDALRSTLNGLPTSEKKADVVLSTGHKAKGREWSSVKLEDDFLLGVRTEDDNAQKKALDETGKPKEPTDRSSELRLFYVAATRGQTKLDVAPKLTEKLEKVRKEQANAKEAA